MHPFPPPYQARFDDFKRAEGAPYPFGASWIESEQSWNFSIFSRHATAVTLLLYNPEETRTPVVEFHLLPDTHRSGAIWHCRFPRDGAPDATYYAWRIAGPHEPENGLLYDSEKVLLDPFSRAVHLPPEFSREAASAPGPNDGRAPVGHLPQPAEPFDWEETHPPRHAHDTIVYELHVKGFTARANSGVTPSKRGTFAGLIEKIPYLLELGITVVELLPVHQFDPQEGNYWGYMTLNFFAPHADYAVGDPALEFKEMVRAFHRAGIEVWLDVVYNHTAEGDQRGPLYSYRGIDNRGYYLVNEDGSYQNDSGCGNTTRCAHAIIRHLVLHSLWHWATDMKVDGFRFDLASVFARDLRGQLDLEQPPVIQEIGGIGALLDVRLVAEAWDIGAYLLGSAFPGVLWRQWNGKFRDVIRCFVKGDPGHVGELMARLYGSDDLFPDRPPNIYHPFQSVNFITAHDGFCLYDLTAYNEKHNEANGHDNTDGSDDNRSWNCGWEGDENAPAEVLALRKKQVRNFFTLLMLANGTPMFCAGDEFLHTQNGNNNPYNQDNETTWLDWSLLEKNHDIFQFFKRMIAFRKSRRMLGRSRYWHGDVAWYGVGRDVDFSEDSRTLAYRLSGAAFDEDDLYVMINAHHEPLRFRIQEGEAVNWRRVLDTSLAAHETMAEFGEEPPLASLDYEVAERSIVVLRGGPRMHVRADPVEMVL